MEKKSKPPNGRWGYQAVGELMPVRVVIICDDEEAAINILAWLRRELIVVQITNGFASNPDQCCYPAIRVIVCQNSDIRVDGFPRGVELLCEIELHLRRIREQAIGFLDEQRHRLPREVRHFLERPLWRRSEDEPDA